MANDVILYRVTDGLYTVKTYHNMDITLLNYKDITYP